MVMEAIGWDDRVRVHVLEVINVELSYITGLLRMDLHVYYIIAMITAAGQVLNWFQNQQNELPGPIKKIGFVPYLKCGRTRQQAPQKKKNPHTHNILKA